MYTNEEASFIRQKFWTVFGKYMLPVPSASSEKVNWVNYKTGIKGISFKMDADKYSATVWVEIFLKDTMLQHRYFEIFNNFAQYFELMAGKNWVYDAAKFIENKGIVSILKVELQNINIYNENDWPKLISFVKKYIMGLDAFWAAYKPAFELI